MPKFLVQHHYYAQITIGYIVDAHDEDQAIDKIEEGTFEPCQLQYDKDTLRLVESDPIEVQEIQYDCATDPNYWDCECRERYINPKTLIYCPRCKTYRDDSPDSRVVEINDSTRNYF